MLRRFLNGFLSSIKLTIVICGLLGLALPALRADALSGSGTAASPYLVSTGDDLDGALTAIAEDYRPVSSDVDPETSTVNLSDMRYIELTADIDAVASSTYGNEDEDHPVRVTIEGNGHTIRGVIPPRDEIQVAGRGEPAIQYTGLRFANRTPWTETDQATGTGRGNHIILKNLTVSGLYNSESHGGGAFAVFGGKFDVDNCAFIGNAAYGGTNRGGGAILLQHRASILSIRNSAFIDNTATGAGGAIDSSGDQDNATESVIIENSTFYGNRSESENGGGAIAYSRAQGRITNCTIVGNEVTSGNGGGVYARDNAGGNPSGLGAYSDITLANSIVAGNGSGSDIGFANRAEAATTSPDLHARITGDYNLVGTTPETTEVSFGGNTLTDVNVSALLASDEPKVNGQGTPTIALSDTEASRTLVLNKIPLADAPEEDQRGFSRVGLADIGAFELQVTGSGTAASPYLVSSGVELNDALTAIADDYRPVSSDVNPDPATSTVNLSDMRYIELTADIDAVASSTYGNEDEDHPVRVTIEGNGHTIRGVIPPREEIKVAGRGEPAIQYTGLRFANRTPWTETNPATGTGRGNHIILKNLTVRGLYNSESHGGGAFAVFGGKFDVDNCAFIGNAAYGGTNRGGGAILLQHRASILSIKNSAFIDNTATGAGGAIDSSGDQDNATESVVIENSTFYGNRSESENGGGAIAYSRAQGRITNCTIVGNEVTSGNGGGVYARDNAGGNPSGLGAYSDITLANSIVAGNGSGSDIGFANRAEAATTSPDLHARITGDYNLVGTTSEASEADEVSFGENTLTGVNVSAFLASGAPMVNDRGTPTIALLDISDSPAIDKADENVAPAKDQRGFARYGLPDIGAYELQPPSDEGDDTDTDDPDTGDDPETPAAVVQPESVTVVSGTETIRVQDNTLVAAIDQAISLASEANTEPTIEIKVREVAGVNVINVEIPVIELKGVAESDVENIRVVTAIGEVTLDTLTMKELIEQAGTSDSVEIVIEHKDTPEEDVSLTEEQKTALSDDTKVHEVYDVSVVINSEKKDFETPAGGKLTIGLPYELRSGEVDEGIWAVHVADDGVIQWMTEGRKNERGKVFFKTNHLSIYAVVYEDEEDNLPEDIDVSGGSSGGCDTGAVAIMTLAAAAVALTGRNRWL